MLTVESHIRCAYEQHPLYYITSGFVQRIALGGLAPSCGCCLKSTATFTSAANVFFLFSTATLNRSVTFFSVDLFTFLALAPLLLLFLLLFPSFPGGF